MKSEPLIISNELESKNGFVAIGGIQFQSFPVNPLNDIDGNASTENILQWQQDFINSLYNPDRKVFYCLRYITIPEESFYAAGKIEAILLVKCIADNDIEVRNTISEELTNISTLLMSFYRSVLWNFIDQEQKLNNFLEPFGNKKLYIAEICRRQEVIDTNKIPPLSNIGFIKNRIGNTDTKEENSIFWVYPFIPRLFSFERLLHQLLMQPTPVCLQIVLEPTTLSEHEKEYLLHDINLCETIQSGYTNDEKQISQIRSTMFARSLIDWFNSLLDAPFLLNIMLSSPSPIPHSIAESVGVAITSPVGALEQDPLGKFKGGYDVLTPTSIMEEKMANKKFYGFSLTNWKSNLIEKNDTLRLRYLMDAKESMCAFRLPLNLTGNLSCFSSHSRPIFPLPKEVAALTAITSQHNTLIGIHDGIGFQQNVYFSHKDRLRHTYVVGQTGTGKSTLLKTMILSDIESGHGVGLIDPHGDLFSEVLSAIPKSRMNDVIIIDPTDDQYPVGINLLEVNDEENRYQVVREMIAIMKRLVLDQYGDISQHYMGPIFFQHMHMNMLLLTSDIDHPGTLLQLYEIYQRNGFWKNWLPLKWKDERLDNWVNNILTDRIYTRRVSSSDTTLGEYLSSKLTDFVFEPRLRYIFGQPHSTIDFSEVMNKRKILLVNLSKGKIGERTSEFLGLMLMGKLQTEILARANTPINQRVPYYLYVDEFQNLATENFSILLSEARKFGVGLVLANQFIHQIDGTGIMNALFGNIGSIIAFRVGRGDAEYLEPFLSPNYSPRDITNLPNHYAFVRQNLTGEMIKPYMVKTVLSGIKNSPSVTNKIIKASQMKYGKSKADIQSIIQESLKEPETVMPDLLTGTLP